VGVCVCVCVCLRTHSHIRRKAETGTFNIHRQKHSMLSTPRGCTAEGKACRGMQTLSLSLSLCVYFCVCLLHTHTHTPTRVHVLSQYFKRICTWVGFQVLVCVYVCVLPGWGSIRAWFVPFQGCPKAHQPRWAGNNADQPLPSPCHWPFPSLPVCV